jgi:radical SAM protein with 4Fe4S-binding SPASM domain
LNEAQYRELQASLPAAREKAMAYGIGNNLGMFGATIPPYMPSEMVGPPVVPCYVGWYFAVILGNGSVMPCCQCTAPIGQVTRERRFADLWASREYAEFRTAARSLPEKSDRLATCECDNCQLRPRKLGDPQFPPPPEPDPSGDGSPKVHAGGFPAEDAGPARSRDLLALGSRRSRPGATAAHAGNES